MMTIGNTTINEEDAIAKAADIRNYADRVNEILDIISQAMSEIDDESTGLYQGTRRAHELREDFEVVKANFGPIYPQMIAFANQLEAAAKVAANQ